MQTSWTELLQYSFQSMWLEVVQVAPKIIIALLIILAGVIVAAALKKVVSSIVSHLQVDKALNAAGLGSLVERAGYTLNTGIFLGTLVKWFIIILFFVVALDVLNLQEATNFLSAVVLSFLPNVIVAVIILLGSIVIANVVAKTVTATADAAGMPSSFMIGRFVKVSIIVFAVLAALNQMRVAPELVQMLFAGIVFALSLALGLAFGLGGRETAARYLDRYTKQSSGTQHNNQSQSGGFSHNHSNHSNHR